LRARERTLKSGPGRGLVLSLKKSLSAASTVCLRSVSDSSASRMVKFFGSLMASP
jgi:hypothetical protein